MRTNIDIDVDDKLLAEARRVTGLDRKKAIVEHGLRELIRMARGREALKTFGKLDWQGDLDRSREGRGAV